MAQKLSVAMWQSCDMCLYSVRMAAVSLNWPNNWLSSWLANRSSTTHRSCLCRTYTSIYWWIQKLTSRSKSWLPTMFTYVCHITRVAWDLPHHSFPTEIIQITLPYVYFVKKNILGQTFDNIYVGMFNRFTYAPSIFYYVQFLVKFITLRYIFSAVFISAILKDGVLQNILFLYFKNYII